ARTKSKRRNSATPASPVTPARPAPVTPRDITADSALPRRLQKHAGPFSGHQAYPTIQASVRETHAQLLGLSDSLKRLRGQSAREQVNLLLASAISTGKAPVDYVDIFVANVTATNAAILEADIAQRAEATSSISGSDNHRRGNRDQPGNRGSPPPPPPPPRSNAEDPA
ncbi:hypothetical protein HDU96_005258, partial [Phlyctochytrium bullatum]